MWHKAQNKIIYWILGALLVGRASLQAAYPDTPPDEWINVTGGNCTISTWPNAYYKDTGTYGGLVGPNAPGFGFNNASASQSLGPITLPAGTVGDDLNQYDVINFVLFTHISLPIGPGAVTFSKTATGSVPNLGVVFSYSLSDVRAYPNQNWFIHDLAHVALTLYRDPFSPGNFWVGYYAGGSSNKLYKYGPVSDIILSFSNSSSGKVFGPLGNPVGIGVGYYFLGNKGNLPIPVPPMTPVPVGSLSVNKARVRDGGLVTLNWAVN